MSVKSPISWLGGKYKLASLIVSLFPEHEHYIEVFAGALHVFFHKYPSELETVNDLNEDLINFWLVCRDRMEELHEKAIWTPYSRSLFLQWKNEPVPEDPIERAARWFYLQCAKVNGVFHGGWGCCKSGGSLAGTPPGERFRIRTARLEAVRDRLSHVQIECTDYQTMIERYGGSEQNLLYLDPPYVGTEREYVAEFTPEDHLILSELLHEVKARVILSYRDNPLIQELYSDWSVYSATMTRHGALSKAGEAKPKAVELLLTNYDIQPTFFD